MTGEDISEDTAQPRLEALGADLDRVYFPDPDMPWRLPAAQAELDKDLEDRKPRLLLIDPILEFLDPSVPISNDQCVRAALSGLARSADRQGCAVLMIRHLNKRQQPYSSTKAAVRPTEKRSEPTKPSNAYDAPSDDRNPAISTLVSRIRVGVITSLYQANPLS